MKIKKNNILFIFALFIIFHLLFNIRSVYQVLNSSNNNYQFLGDYSQAEYSLENNYQKIKNLELPFLLENELG